MFNNIQDVEFWCQKILPTVYDDSLSYLQAIGRLKKIVNEMIQAINILGQSNKELTDMYGETVKKLLDIEMWMDEYLKGNKIPDGSITLNKLADDVQHLIKELVVNTVRDIAKFVWFGLDDDGYFIAVIPDTWDEISFDTTPKGELVLTY